MILKEKNICHHSEFCSLKEIVNVENYVTFLLKKLKNIEKIFLNLFFIFLEINGINKL
jgi:hypothetical protein